MAFFVGRGSRASLGHRSLSMANSYNGYSWQERMAKFKEM